MRRANMMSIALATVWTTALAAQVATKPAPSPAAPPSLKQLGMIIYPAQKQSPDQQAKDEAACTQWAEAQTGVTVSGGSVDTEAAAKAAQEQTAQATQGAAVAGAAKGALVGTAMGAVTGNAGEGAAIGAIGGAVAGRRAKKQAEAQAAQKGAQQATAQNQAMVEQFKKAAKVCLEGRGYTVS